MKKSELHASASLIGKPQSAPKGIQIDPLKVPNRLSALR